MRGEAINKTRLSVDDAERRGFIHRDYLAHCLRWSHIVKHLTRSKKEMTRVLDIGCGDEAPLAKLIYTSKLGKFIKYIGIDAGTVKPDINFVSWHPQFCSKALFPDLFDDPLEFDVIVCLEVIEHVALDRQRTMLNGICTHLSADGTAFISTPCFNVDVGAAANHINELTHQALGYMIEEAGLAVESVYGTFASQRDYKAHLADYHLEKAYEALQEYYDSSLISILFAPLYPRESRNCIWRVIKMPKNYKRQYETPGNVPHGSSSLDILGDGNGENKTT